MKITKPELEELAGRGLDEVKTLSGIREAEVFVASNEVDTTKVHYTSDIPCNGVEQPSCIKTEGVGVRVVLEDGKYGFAGESSLAPGSALNAARKAVATASHNLITRTLPKPVEDRADLVDYHDSRIMESGGAESVRLGYRCLDGTLGAWGEAGFNLPENRLILSGDVTTAREAIAISSTSGIKVTDLSTVIWAFLTSMIQQRNSKGTGWAIGSSLDNFSPETAGRMAAENAVRTVDGERIQSGRYDVVLGPQAVADLVNHFLQFAVNAYTFGLGYTPIRGKFGQQAISQLLNMYDDGSVKGFPASKAFTCEGLPTERTDLIKEGRLVGFLSSFNTAKLWNEETDDPQVREYRANLLQLLGTTEIPVLRGRNGFRFGRGGGRQYMGEPSPEATNLIISGNETVPDEELISGQRLGNGLYVGTLWYTYPIHGMGAGDVTSTIIANSSIIRNGKVVNGLQPNTVRINDNVVRMFNNVVAVGNVLHDAIVWGLESVIRTPLLMIKDVYVDNIADYMGKAT